MKTFSFSKKVLRALNVSVDRRYYVDGSIIFMFHNPPSSKCSNEILEKLIQLIEEVDSKYPWRDSNDNTGKAMRSIGYIGKPYQQFNNWVEPELNIWIDISPGPGGVRKGQIYAYEKYIETLAEEIAKRDSGACTVRSQFRVMSSSKDFKV